MSSVNKPIVVRTAQILSTTTSALILGSTTWASVAVMPSLIAAPVSTYDKLSVFKGLILRANSILPPIFLTAISSLGYLAYTATVAPSRRNYLIGAGALVTALALQIPVLPRNRAMLQVVERGEGKEDDGRKGNWMIGELLRLNWGRVVLSAVAFGIGVFELQNEYPYVLSHGT